MNYSIVYSSPNNTRLLADVVESTLSAANAAGTGNQCVYFGPTDEKALDADRIYLGFWTNKGTCDDISADFIKKLSAQEIFLFGSAGFGMDQDYFDKILDKVKAQMPAGCKVVGTFMCQGKMPMSVKERYLKMKKEKAPVPNLDMLIENFDMALSHPDEKDFENLKDAVSD